MIEYESVLKRPKTLRSAGISADDADVILDQLAASMAHVEVYYLWRPVLRNAEDDMVLETAVNGRVEVIVTFNIGDFGTMPGRLGIEVLRPGALLRRL